MIPINEACTEYQYKSPGFLRWARSRLIIGVLQSSGVGREDQHPVGLRRTSTNLLTFVLVKVLMTLFMRCSGIFSAINVYYCGTEMMAVSLFCTSDVHAVSTNLSEASKSTSFLPLVR